MQHSYKNAEFFSNTIDLELTPSVTLITELKIIEMED